MAQEAVMDVDGMEHGAAGAEQQPDAQAADVPAPGGGPQQDPGEPAEGEQAQAPADPLAEKLDSLWSQLKANSGDFQGWTALIAAAEQLDDLERLRQAYDALLAEYPLCFGYWKKYADAEARHGQAEQAGVVFERGVAAVPYSVDMWAQYCGYRLGAGASQEEVEGLFERAAAYVGSDYHAHGLWDRYLRYEHAISNTQALAQLYTRILALPIRDLERYHSELLGFAKDHTAAELATPEEAAEIRGELEAALRAALEAAAAKKRLAAAQAPAAESGGGTGADAGTDVDAGAPAAPSEGPAVNGLAEPTGDGAAPMEAEGGSEEQRQEQQEQAQQQERPGPAEAAPEAAEPAAAAEGEDVAMAEAAPAAAPAQGGLNEPAGAAEAADAAAGSAAPAEGPADAAAQQGKSTAGDGEAAAAAAVPIAIPDIADADVKRQWLARREAVYKLAKEELQRRQQYEAALRRPYFHTKPLDPTQLAAWCRYLDYVEAQGDDAATVRLYERCLVACASYPELWMRYIRYLDSKGESDRAQDAFTRATTLYCKRSPQLALFAARRHELPPAGGSGGTSASAAPDAARARAEYERVAGELAPGMLQCTVQRANFERRKGDPAAACRVFEEHIAAAQAELAADGGSSSSSDGADKAGVSAAAGATEAQGAGAGGAASYAFLVIQYAHFLHTVLGDAERARRAYRNALALAPHVRALWEGAVHLEAMARGEGYVGRVLELYEQATAPPASPQQQEQQQQQGQQGPAAAEMGSSMSSVPDAAAADAPRDGATQQQPAAAAAAGSGGLAQRDREELSERMVVFADLHGSAEDLQRADQIHSQRFKVPLALLEGAQRGGAKGGGAGAQPGGGAEHAAAAGTAVGTVPDMAVAGDGADAAAHAAMASMPSAAMDYYHGGAAGYYGTGYGTAAYGGYGSYYGGYY